MISVTGHDQNRDLQPSPAFLEALERLRRECPDALGGPALDLACGAGRHALVLARNGIETHAIDRDPALIARLEEQARNDSLELRAAAADLETGEFALPEGAYSLVLVVNYLHRPLLPAIEKSLRRGGALYYETFTVGQARLGEPTNPDFLLERGELRRALLGLEAITYFEGMTSEGTDKAVLLARRP